MNSQTAKKLAEKVLGTGKKGFLVVVFPENHPAVLLRKKDISFATNANNDVVLHVAALLIAMVAKGDYQQEIVGEGGLPELPPAKIKELE